MNRAGGTTPRRGGAGGSSPGPSTTAATSPVPKSPSKTSTNNTNRRSNINNNTSSRIDTGLRSSNVGGGSQPVPKPAGAGLPASAMTSNHPPPPPLEQSPSRYREEDLEEYNNKIASIGSIQRISSLSPGGGHMMVQPFNEVSFSGSISIARTRIEISGGGGAGKENSNNKKGTANNNNDPLSPGGDGGTGGNKLIPAAPMRRCLVSVPSQGTVWVGDEAGNLSVRDNVTGTVIGKSPLPKDAAPNPKDTATRLSQGLKHPAPKSNSSTHHKFGPINALCLVDRIIDGRGRSGSARGEGASPSRDGRDKSTSPNRRGTTRGSQGPSSTSSGGPAEVWIGTGSGTLLSISTLDNSLICEVPHAHSGMNGVTALCYLKYPIGRNHVVSGGTDATVKIWDADLGAAMRMLRVLKVHELGITGIAAPSSRHCPQALFAVSADDSTVSLWDDKLENTASLEGHEGSVLSMVFVGTSAKTLHLGSDGVVSTASPLKSGGGAGGTKEVLWTGGEDGTIRLWDAIELECLQVLEHHQNPVVSLLYNEGEYKVWSASCDGHVVAWDPTTGSILCQLEQNRTINSMFPVAKAAVWRLWVAGDDGITNCYLSQTVDETIETQHAGKLLEESMAQVADQHAELVRLSQQLEAAHSEIDLVRQEREMELNKYSKEIDRLHRLQKQLNEERLASEEAAHEAATYNNNRNSPSRYSNDGSDRSSPPRSMHHDLVSAEERPPMSMPPPPSPSAYPTSTTLTSPPNSGYRGGAPSYQHQPAAAAVRDHLDIALLELEERDERFARGQIEALQAHSLHTLATIFYMGNGTIATMYREIENIASELEFTKERMYQRELAFDEEVELLKAQMNLGTAAGGGPSGKMVDEATSPGPQRPGSPEGASVSPTRKRHSPGAALVGGNVDPTELETLRQTIRDLQQDLFDQRQSAAERIGAVEKERVRELNSLREVHHREIMKLQDALATQHTDYVMMQDRLVVVSGEAKTSDNLCNELQSDLKEARTRLKEKQMREEELSNEVVKLRALSTSSNQLIERNEKLVLDLAQQKERTEELRQKLTVAEIDNADSDVLMRHDLKRLAQEADELKEVLAQVEGSRSKLADENQKFKQDLLAMREPWESMKAALKESHAALDEVRAQCITDLTTMEELLEEKEREIIVLKKSLNNRPIMATPQPVSQSGPPSRAEKVAPIRLVTQLTHHQETTSTSGRSSPASSSLHSSSAQSRGRAPLPSSVYQQHQQQQQQQQQQRNSQAQRTASQDAAVAISREYMDRQLHSVHQQQRRDVSPDRPSRYYSDTTAGGAGAVTANSQPSSRSASGFGTQSQALKEVLEKMAQQEFNQ